MKTNNFLAISIIATIMTSIVPMKLWSKSEPVKATQDALNSDVVIKNQISTYEVRPDYPNAYLLKTSTGETQMEIVGSGVFSNQKVSINKTETSTLNPDNGYQQVTLNRFSSDTLTININTDMLIDGPTGAIRLTYEDQLSGSIMNGNWEQFESGEEITFKLDATSEKMSRRRIANRMSSVLQDGLKASLDGTNTKLLTNVSISNQGVEGSFCKANKEKLTCFDSLIKLEMSIKVIDLK
jgi:hypothetical protein